MIGLYGGTCNNMYVFAKELVKENVDVIFIQDRKDNFPHSQPVWDDIECHFPSGFDYKSIDWDAFEKEYHWLAPSWYFKPRKSIKGEFEIFKKSRSPFFIKLIACRILRHKQDSLSVFNKMRECDFLIVCGIDAEILAMLSGKPYMIFPHGSDMRMAIGAKTSDQGIKAKIIERLVAYSFNKAAVIGSTMPDASAAVTNEKFQRLKNVKVDRVAMPYSSQDRLDKSIRIEKLKSLFDELGLELKEADYYSFTPSRINFKLKGHDRLLDAINANKNKNLNIHFIFLGWGLDYQKALEFVKKNGLQELITIIPIFCSKKFLFRFFEAVDVVIDAFKGAGGYGTSLSEAWSRGCPVVTWVSDMFEIAGWEAPPVIQARDKHEISNVIHNISIGQLKLEEWSNKTAEWFKSVHSRQVVASVIRERFGSYLS